MGEARSGTNEITADSRNPQAKSLLPKVLREREPSENPGGREGKGRLKASGGWAQSTVTGCCAGGCKESHIRLTPGPF